MPIIYDGCARNLSSLVEVLNEFEIIETVDKVITDDKIFM